MVLTQRDIILQHLALHHMQKEKRLKQLELDHMQKDIKHKLDQIKDI
jgi:hypothetical protein